MIKITTSTGSYYTFSDDLQRWSKNGDTVHTTWEFGAVPGWEDNRAEATRNLIAYAHNHGEMNRLPKVGECLYVYNKDVWWLSTPVTKIEEL